MNDQIRTEDTPVRVFALTRRFGKKTALDDVTLDVRPGRVFGLVGENGAGKTTLMRHVMGLLRPTSGGVFVFGDDPVTHPEQALERIGYLSENRDLPNWMRVRDTLAFTKPFFPDWDDRFAEELREMFGLDPTEKVKSLSRGQRAQLGLTLALAHRPPLLVLDEPSSGLDPVVRRDILTAIIRTVADEGRTVFLSSHLLDEVECVADDVALLHNGRVLFSAPLEEVKARYHFFTFRLNNNDGPPLLPKEALAIRRIAGEWTMMWIGDKEAARALLADKQATIVEESAPSLEDIFISHIRPGDPAAIPVSAKSAAKRRVC